MTLIKQTVNRFGLVNVMGPKICKTVHNNILMILKYFKQACNIIFAAVYFISDNVLFTYYHYIYNIHL